VCIGRRVSETQKRAVINNVTIQEKKLHVLRSIFTFPRPHTTSCVSRGVLACLTFSFSFLTKMLCGKPPVPDTLTQSQIGEEVSSSRLNYTGETRNSSRAEAAWTRRKNTPMQVATEQSTRLVFPGSRNGADYCRSAHHALEAIPSTVGQMRKDQTHLTFCD